MRFFHWPWTKRSDFSGSRSADPHRLLTEYVLNMSISCLGDHDVTPLYEEYIQDSRLGKDEKEELTSAYRSLNPSRRVAVAT